MASITLTYTLPEEYADAKLALDADSYQSALHRVSQEIFRPARRHGYDDEKLQAILKEYPIGKDIIGILEDMFYRIVKEEDIELV